MQVQPTHNMHAVYKPLGPGHTTSEMTATVTFTATAKNVVNRSHSKLRSVTQEENGVYRVVVDLPFVAVSALRSLWTSQESSSRQFACCLSPAGLAQEPPCMIAIVVELRVAFPPVPGQSALYSCFTAFLGSTKEAEHVGEKCVLSLEKYGEEVS